VKYEFTQKTIILFLLFTSLLSAQNVIIVLIDGARYTETFGGGNTYIPHMFDDMRPNGYLYSNFRIADEGQTRTNPGHASILTGTWQQIANDGSQRPTNPTVFEYFRKELGVSVTGNYLVGGKSKLTALAYSTDSLYGNLYQGSTSCETITDNEVYDNLVSIMDKYHPRLIMVNFADTDRAGHDDNWSNYLEVITNADDLVYKLWQKIENDDFYKNTTTLFVTNDHGRHDDQHGGFKSHGDDCEGCEHILLLAMGRNVTKGGQNNEIHYQIDLCPTIGNLLGFDTPQSRATCLYLGKNPLPIKLSFFRAHLEGSEIQLEWGTESEVNNYGFDILRQSDKSGQNDEWIKLGFVNGYTNSNSQKTYGFTDHNPTGGSKFNYKLRQIDISGTDQYMDSVNIEIVPKEFMLYQNHPNPFNPDTKIKYTIPPQPSNAGNNRGKKAELVTIKVFDIFGEEVVTLLSEKQETGIYEIDFDGSNFDTGIYIYQMQAGNFISARKMLILKEYQMIPKEG